MENVIKNIFELFRQFSISDCILFLTFLVLAWYSWETHMLRQWQKKQVQATLFSIEMERFMNHGKLGGLSLRIPLALRKIYELGEFDLRDFYVDKEPLKKRDRFATWLKTLVKKVRMLKK